MRSRRDESDECCFMVQGNNSLEVQSETQLDASSSSYCNECLDAQAMNDELAKNCENLISKYKLLKKKNLALKEENKSLSSDLRLFCKKRKRFQVNVTHLNPN